MDGRVRLQCNEPPLLLIRMLSQSWCCRSTRIQILYARFRVCHLFRFDGALLWAVHCANVSISLGFVGRFVFDSQHFISTRFKLHWKKPFFFQFKFHCNDIISSHFNGMSHAQFHIVPWNNYFTSSLHLGKTMCRRTFLHCQNVIFRCRCRCRCRYTDLFSSKSERHRNGLCFAIKYYIECNLWIWCIMNIELWQQQTDYSILFLINYAIAKAPTFWIKTCTIVDLIERRTKCTKLLLNAFGREMCTRKIQF